MSAVKDSVLDSLRAEISAIESSSNSPFSCSRKEKNVTRGSGQVERSGGSKSAFGKQTDYGFDSSEEGAFSKIERLISRREYSREELRRKLVRCEFAESDIDAALDRAVACGLVSDGRFAEVLVRSRIAQGKGLDGISRELESHGVDPYSVDLFVEAKSGSIPPEVDRGLELLRRRPPHSKNPRESAYRRLVSKGYASAVASSAARLWFDTEYSDSTCNS